MGFGTNLPVLVNVGGQYPDDYLTVASPFIFSYDAPKITAASNPPTAGGRLTLTGLDLGPANVPGAVDAVRHTTHCTMPPSNAQHNTVPALPGFVEMSALWCEPGAARSYPLSYYKELSGCARSTRGVWSGNGERARDSPRKSHTFS